MLWMTAFWCIIRYTYLDGYRKAKYTDIVGVNKHTERI